MARVPRVSRSGFHGWLAKGEPEDPWARLREAVWRVWSGSDRTLGARLVSASLPDGSAGTTPCRVRKRMREPGIRGIAPNSRKRTTIPDGSAPARPDLAGRDLASPVPTYKLVGDTAHPKAKEGWPCLATVTGLRTRMVVGWAISERTAADIAAGAPGRAWRRGCVAGNATFHSDRGSQHASRLLARRAEGHGIRPSVGRTGSCHGDAVAESFFGTLRSETCGLRKWATREDARNAVIDRIERRHNRNRPHSTIDYKVPAQPMEALFERTRPVGPIVDQGGRLEKMAA